MKKIIVLLTIFFYTSLVANASVYIKPHDQILEPYVALVGEIAKLYDAAYGLNYDTLHLFFQETEEKKELDNGSIAVTLAHAEPGGEIYFYKSALESTNERLEHIIAHELFHTLKDPKKDANDIVPIRLDLTNSPQEIFFTGWDGLLALGTIDDGLGEGTICAYIDEGCAEVCASRLIEGYTVTDPRYYHSGSALLYLIDNTDMSIDDIVSNAKNNNLKGLVSAMLGTRATNIDISKVVEVFMKIKVQAIDDKTAYFQILDIAKNAQKRNRDRNRRIIAFTLISLSIGTFIFFRVQKRKAAKSDELEANIKKDKKKRKRY